MGGRPFEYYRNTSSSRQRSVSPDNIPSTSHNGQDRSQDEPPPVEATKKRSSTDLAKEIVLLVGHNHDPPQLIDLMVHARMYFDRGDNRRASALLKQLARQAPSVELRRLAHTLHRRIRPDWRAVTLAAILLVALVVIWFLTMRAGG